MKHVIALVLALGLNAAANLMMKVGSGRFSTSGLNAEPGLRSLTAAGPGVRRPRRTGSWRRAGVFPAKGAHG